MPSAETYLGATVKVLFSDNDVAIGMDVTFLTEDLGIQILNSACYADSQHGKPEQAGAIIMMRMRSMIIAAHLPQVLWPLAAQVASYLLNRTPSWTRAIDGSHVWTTPHERMLGYKPNLANLHVFGCCAYVCDPKVPQGQKMAPRAWIGYLVSFEASNIWQIWNPHHQEVVKERDVIFDESLFYDPDLPLPQDLLISLPDPAVQTSQLPLAIQEADAETSAHHEPHGDELYDDDFLMPSKSATQMNHTLKLSHEHPVAHDSSQPITPEHTPLPDSPRQGGPGGGYASPPMLESSSQIPDAFADSAPATPESTNMEVLFVPEPPEDDPGDADPSSLQLLAELEHILEADTCSDSCSITAGGGDNSSELSYSNRHNTALRAQEISADLDPSLAITGKCKRQPHNIFAIYQGFSLSMQKALNPLISTEPLPGVEPTSRIHRNDLPVAPGNFHKLKHHHLCKWFMDAMELELSTLESKGTWSIEWRPANIFVIPTIWVYSYKFDDDGFLKRAKAHLCVQGNKQVMTHVETRAATLASQCF